MSSMYHQDLLDEAKHPRRHGLLADPDEQFNGTNSSCGDSVEITVKFDEAGTIAEIGWTGDGCVMSQASLSVLADWSVGKSVSEVKKLTVEDMLDLLGLTEISPGRVKCVMLGVKAIASS